MAIVLKIILSPLDELWMTGRSCTNVTNLCRTVFSFSTSVYHTLRYLLQFPYNTHQIDQAPVRDLLRNFHQTTTNH